jgi:hypothetical protein
MTKASINEPIRINGLRNVNKKMDDILNASKQRQRDSHEANRVRICSGTPRRVIDKLAFLTQVEIAQIGLDKFKLESLADGAAGDSRYRTLFGDQYVETLQKLQDVCNHMNYWKQIKGFTDETPILDLHQAWDDNLNTEAYSQDYQIDKIIRLRELETIALAYGDMKTEALQFKKLRKLHHRLLRLRENWNIDD